MTLLGAILLALLAIVVLRWRSAPAFLTASRNLQAIVPLAIAAAAIGITWNAWGSLDPLATVSDEAAYVLQAKLLAQGHIAGDAPPIGEFFEQAHVLVTPRLAPKYPIGFGLALAPGVLLGAPALIPLLLTGLSGALVFLLCRRIWSGSVAVLAAAIWLAGPGGRFRAGYFSETLSGAMCLLAWYALLRWRAERTSSWLVTVAAAIAMAAITRPLTALVFALPIAFVTMRDVVRLRTWRPAGAAAAVAFLVLAALPIQDAATGGPWWQLTYGRYTRAYLPFDRMGLGLDSTPPARTRPPDLERLARAYSAVHRDYTASRVAPALVARFEAYLSDLAGEWVLSAFVLLIAGVVTGPAALRFGAGTVVLLFLAHLPYAHPPEWSLYYSEALPVGAAAIAAGVAVIASWVAARLSVDRPTERTALLLLIVSAAAMWPLPERISATRLTLEVSREPLLRFQAAAVGVQTPAVIFVRYAPGHRMHRSIIQNPSNYGMAPVWTVYDRGDDNVRLLAVAGGRNAYLYDERWERVIRLDSTASRSTDAP